MANIILSQKLYPLFNMLEVVLRNRINFVLSSRYPTVSWLTGIAYSQKIPLNYNPSHIHVVLPETAVKKVGYTILELGKKAKNNIYHDDVIAELNFSFWVNFFTKKNLILPIYKKQKRISLIDSKKKFFSKEDILHNLLKLKEIRNRISHHETIWFKPCLDEYKSFALRIIYMMEPSMVSFLQSVCTEKYLFEPDQPIPYDDILNSAQENAKKANIV